ncbi:MAG TPA: hypothetical protein VMZ53_15310, partial [Kofleriaceae bacterium]|nr:hypothetical protein [Kofleriaceae bacterium]
RSTRTERVRFELPDLGSIQRLVSAPDGKLLVIGDEGIARLALNASGGNAGAANGVAAKPALDASFGQAGVARIELKNAELQAATIDAKGRVIVVGHITTMRRAEDLLVVRLRPNGVLDASFGKEGIVTADFGSTDDRPSAVFAVPGGDIVVIGSHQQGKDGERYEGYLVRLDAKGQRRDKVAFFDCIPKSREFVTRALRDGDGFVVAGYAYNATADDSGVYIARVRENGTLDPAFGEAGVRRVRGGDLGRSVAWELATAKNGDFLLGGSSGEEIAKYRGFVMRFDHRGALVPTWGTEGTAWPSEGVKWISMVVEDHDDGPGGGSGDGGGDDSGSGGDAGGVIAVNQLDGSLTRFDAQGVVDRGFGSDGIVKGRADDDYDAGIALDNGDIVVAGDKQLVVYAR